MHRHCRELGYCNRGLREWFGREGLSWPDFVKHGIDADILRARNNCMADRAVERAEMEQNDGR